MLRNREFDIATPATVEEAVAILSREDRSMVIAGGTDLVPKLKRGQFEPTTVVSLAKLQGLDFIRNDDEDRPEERFYAMIFSDQQDAA